MQSISIAHPVDQAPNKQFGLGIPVANEAHAPAPLDFCECIDHRLPRRLLHLAGLFEVMVHDSNETALYSRLGLLQIAKLSLIIVGLRVSALSIH